jgi:hypothetical protein
VSRGSSGRLNRNIRRKAQWSVVVTTLEILQLAWPATTADVRITAATDEDKITDVLRWKMVDAKRTRKPPSAIRFERETQSDRREDDTDSGLIDIRVEYTWNEETYLTMECKRLTSIGNDLARKYVRDGITRFASGKYSAGHAYGIMVGYVICGNRPACVERLKKALSKEPMTATGFDEVFGWQTDSESIPGLDLYKTQHQQSQYKNRIELIHAFLNVAD